MKKIVMLPIFIILNGCSIYEAAHAPAPVEYKNVNIGLPRDEVIKTLGFPKMTKKNSEGEQDTFEFIDGNSSASKSRILLYLAGDVFTAGLAELIFWPMESNLLDGEQCLGSVNYDRFNKVSGYDIKNKKGATLWFSPVNIKQQVTIIRNRFTPSATVLDFEKTKARCRFEADKSTVDTSRKNPSKVMIPTTNLDVYSAQRQAQLSDEIDELSHGIDLELATSKIYQECLASEGYVYHESTDQKDIDIVESTCKSRESFTAPCFIPGY